MEEFLTANVIVAGTIMAIANVTDIMAANFIVANAKLNVANAVVPITYPLIIDH